MPGSGTVQARVAAGCEVKLNGSKVDDKSFHQFIVDQDLDQPDMCSLVLNNTPDHSWSTKTNIGDSVEIKIGQDSSSADFVFKGEVVGIEPVFDAGGESRVTVRAFNRLHRLSRGRQSRTYEKMTDNDMISKIAGENSLSAKTTSDVNIKYDHIYQHNQTDLEFILQRAALIDYEVFVDDKDLNFRKRDLSKDSGIKIEFDARADYSLQRFSPRLSTAGMVQEVNVRGWNPDKKEEILGKATAPASKLGGTDGPSVANSPFGKKFYYDVGYPVKTVEEANAIAKAKLEELSLNFITGEGVMFGHPKIKAGIVVTIACNDTRFNGKYYITSCSHRYTHENKGGGKGGYLTAFKVRKNAEK
jgi:phage protein D